MPWDVGTGGNFTVTRSSFLAVGGNDERLGTGTAGRAGNDLDLFRRLMRAGVETRFEPDMLVLHERATRSEAKNRNWTYGFGVGACVASWMRQGDRWALRVALGWLHMRARLTWGALRRRHGAVGEIRVLLGTVHGLWYGLRRVLPPAASTDR
jgi:GT2 family glycosyltransferase